MKYRSRLVITTAILRYLHSANGFGATKTRVMYGAYLSTLQTEQYIELLQSVGAIAMRTSEKDSSMGTYHLTEKGARLLKLCEEVEWIEAVPRYDRRAVQEALWSEQKKPEEVVI